MIVKKYYLMSAFVAFALLSITCTEKTIVQSNIGDVVHLTGVLYVWRCIGPRDPFADPHFPDSNRFSVNTEESARITFIRDNGFVNSWLTDSSSAFERFISAGSYLAIVETGYTWPPDTFYNLHFKPGDTTLSINIIYDVVDPLHITFAFHYPLLQERLSAKEEFDAIIKVGILARRPGIPGPLYALYSMASDTFFTETLCFSDSSDCWVMYDVPVIRKMSGYGELWNVLDAFYAIWDAMQKDTGGTVVPNNMSIWPTGGYVCHTDQIQYFRPDCPPLAVEFNLSK
ncbi:MAG: hypothetical protein ACREBV_03765 [Candidatus Zixiibacteriota bacterium]